MQWRNFTTFIKITVFLPIILTINYLLYLQTEINDKNQNDLLCRLQQPITVIKQ